MKIEENGHVIGYNKPLAEKQESAFLACMSFVGIVGVITVSVLSQYLA